MSVRVGATLSLVFVIACSTRGGGSSDAGTGAPSPGPSASSDPVLSLGNFDAAMPVCPSGVAPRVADAGPIPMRDCGAGPSLSFAADIKPLLAAHCTGEICHEGSWASSPREYEDLVNTPTTECCDGRKRIDPVHPDQSYLLEKLRGVDLCAGRRMPLSGSVTDAEIAEIARWVCMGAPR